MIFEHEFMKHAFVAILLLSPIFGIIGTMVVNNRMAFFSDAIGHSTFTGLAIGTLAGLSDLTYSAIVFAIIFAIGITVIKHKSKTSLEASSDTIISVFSSIAVALGIAILSRGGGFKKYSTYLIGDLLSITQSDLILLAIIFLLIILFWYFIYNKLFLASLNPSLAKVKGLNLLGLDLLFTIMISTSNLEDSFVIEISDQGCGIRNEDIEKIFDNFFTTKAPGKGLGLGLSIVRSLMTEMHGNITVTSNIDTGTIVTMRFPSAAMKEIPAFKEQSDKAFHLDHKGSVLIVDDEEGLRMILSEHLTNFGLNVTALGNGFDALKEMRREKYDYFMIDITMPEMSGIELIRMAAHADLLKDSKVIFITGNAILDLSSEDPNEFKLNDYKILFKPFSTEDLYLAFKK